MICLKRRGRRKCVIELCKEVAAYEEYKEEEVKVGGTFQWS